MFVQPSLECRKDWGGPAFALSILLPAKREDGCSRLLLVVALTRFRLGPTCAFLIPVGLNLNVVNDWPFLMRPGCFMLQKKKDEELTKLQEKHNVTKEDLEEINRPQKKK